MKAGVVMSSIILETMLVIFIYFLCFFIVGTLIKNNSIVDIGWGLGIISFFSGSSILVFLSPITITYLLLFVSGVPMLEKSFANRPGYKEYAEKTPVFFPWFPKKD